jgi:hypothetical protein
MTDFDMDPRDRPSHVRPPSPYPYPRRSGRSRIVVKAVAAAIAVAMLAWGARYAVDYFSASGSSAPAAPSGQVPVIGPDAGPVKVVPDNPGGVTVPDQDKVILNGASAQPKVEQLLPPPENPVASPALPQAVQTPLPVQAPAPAPQAAQAQSSPPPKPQAAPPANLIPPPPPPKPTALQAPPPAPAASTAKPAAGSGNSPAGPPAQILPPGKGYFLQLGALRTVEAAQASWTQLKAAQPDILGKLPANAVKIDLGGDRGVFYRVMAGPIADESAAERNCNTLKQRHVACILVKP